MKKTALNPVNNVLTEVMTSLGLDKRLREHTFMSLWPSFVSSTIAERSRPLFIDQARNLVVSVADAACGQDLSMQKGQVLGKVVKAAKALNIEITGLRLDLKHYHATSTVAPAPPEDKPLPKPSLEDLQAITLDPRDVFELDTFKASCAADDTADSKLQQKIILLFESQLRLRRWRFQNGFPVCPACRNPVERLHAGNNQQSNYAGAKVCISCLNA